MLKKLIPIFCMLLSCLSADFDATIPVLDMEDYRDPERREKFVQALYDAFRDVGFVAVVNADVDQSVLDNAYAAMDDFFHLPFDEKMQSFRPECAGERGFTPGESAKGQSEKDCKEFYGVGRELSGLLENVWPDSGDLKKSLTALYAELDRYKEEFEGAIALAIGVEKNFFTQMTGDADVTVRANYYPSSSPESQVWNAAHTDIDLFTILPRATASGLQVQSPQGEWIDVEVPEDAFIINAGDMLQNMTNGEFRSSRHRVVAKESGYERFSVVSFVHPKDEDRLDPLPVCIERTGGEAKFPTASRRELLAERLIDLGLATDEMIEHIAKSGLVERMIDLGLSSPDVCLELRKRGLASEEVLEELNRLEL